MYLQCRLAKLVSSGKAGLRSSANRARIQRPERAHGSNVLEGGHTGENAPGQELPFRQAQMSLGIFRGYPGLSPRFEVHGVRVGAGHKPEFMFSLMGFKK